MSEHIDRVRRAIEFQRPDALPMEIVDVPGVYNAYHTLDPETVRLVPGTETFDALWPCCYSWFHEVVGETPEGEPLKRDQFGTLLKTPAAPRSAYALLEHPLAGRDSLEGYAFPDPEATDPAYERLGRVIRERYPDRFVDGFVDAGIFLTTQLLLGMQEFLLKVASAPDFVTEVYDRVAAYYEALVPKYKRAGAHMITLIEDIGGTNSLVLNPETWRKRFKPITRRFLRTVHEHGLYAGLCIDGHSGDVLDDLLEMEVDVFTVFDVKTTGLDLLRRRLAGRLCVKACVDMQTTLASGSPEQVRRDAQDLVEAFATREGGFICQVVRWHRPEYPAANVQASVEAFNRYRRT